MRHSPFLTAMQSRPNSLPPLGIKLLPTAIFLAFGCTLPMHGWSQIRTDGSVGPGAQTLTGPRYQIGENLGRLSGQNLFHSFQSFNLVKGESANFTTSSAGINNVISRVTGGTASQINGQISLAAASGAPNFYFINPAGVTFGAGASIDVPGAFHVSTADYLKFADGKFFADAKAASTFSAATPESFGFLGNSRASVNVMDNAELRPRLEQSVSLVAGDVSVDNALVQTVGGGTIRVAAVGVEAKEIPISGPLPSTSGNVSVLNAGMIRSLSGATAPVLETIATQEEPAPSTSPDPSGNGNGNGRSGPPTPPPASAPTPNQTVTTREVKPSEPRNGGNIAVSTGDLILDGKSNFNNLTGILSASVINNGANAGNIDVNASRSVNLRDNGVIVGQTFFNGNAGNVNVSAKSVLIDGTTSATRGPQLYTAIGSGTFPGATGNGGTVVVTASETVTLRNTGVVSSPTFSAGNAGSVKVTAANINIDGQGNTSNDTGITSTAAANSTGNAGTVEVSASGTISIANNGFIDSSTLASGNAGMVKVSAGSITMDGKTQGAVATISSLTLPGSSGKGGTVEVNVSGPLNLRNGSLIDSSTQGSGDAGSVKVNAASINVAGGTGISSISSVSSGGKGSAGNVEVNSTGDLLIATGGVIQTSNFGSGAGGNIKISAGNLGITGDANSRGSAGIFSFTTGAGYAGNIEIVSPGTLIITQNGAIDSSTAGSGNAGLIKINAHDFYIGAEKGQAGVSNAVSAGSSGNAGTIEINVSNLLAVLNNGYIVSPTSGFGNAGTIKINAGKVGLTGTSGISTVAAEGSSGNAGQIVITTSDYLVVMKGAGINSSTKASGDAGSINLDIGGSLSLTEGGFIESATSGKGAAGSINVKANSIGIDGKNSAISASAAESSSGQTGTLNIKAAQSLELTNGGVIAIINLATIPEVTTTSSLVSSLQPFSTPIAATTTRQPAPTQINISASDVTINNGIISADSTGNVSASNIDIDVSRSTSLNAGRISTSANRGNGGSVTIKSREPITINRSQVTTSVQGTSGNGGDINLESPSLIMNTGFIQANTAAKDARGGNVGIKVDNLIPSLGTLIVGGEKVMDFNPNILGLNVIQAAAPTGVTGNVKISSPSLNISGTLMALKYQILDTGGLARNPCQVSKGSSLTQSGRGSLPVSASNLLVPVEGGAATAVPINTSQYGSDLFSRWSCHNG